MSKVTLQGLNDSLQPHRVVLAHHHLVWTLAYLPDGQVVTGSADGTIKVWKMEDGWQEGTSMQHGDMVTSLTVTRDGKKIISGAEDGSVKVWDAQSHQLVKEWSESHPDEYPASIAISPDDRLVAIGYWTVFIHAVEEEWHIKQSIEVGTVFCMSFSPNGHKLACDTIDNEICVYDVSNGTLVLRPLTGHKNRVWSLLWSYDGSRLFSGSDNKTIRCWDSATGELVGHPWTGHTDWITSLSLSPDGSILASTSGDETVRFWDTATGNAVGQPLRHESQLLVVCFSPSGEFAASAGQNRKLYVWRVPLAGMLENRVNVYL